MKGLKLYKNIIPTPLIQKIVYDELDALFGDNSYQLLRQTLHYGYTYDYTIREPRTIKLKKTTQPPEWIKCLGDLFFEDGLLKNRPNQYIINKYLPGEGISAHRDHHPIFGNSIATLSLGSEYIMEFKSHKTNKHKNIKKEIVLPIGSLLVMSDSSRYFYTHEIKKRKSDIINNVRKKRGNRISITFRTVNSQFCQI